MKPDQERVSTLLMDTITLLCKNGLTYNRELRVQGLLGITTDENEVFIVQLNEHITEDTKTAVSFRTPDEHASETNASNNAFRIQNSSSPVRNTPQQRKRSHASTGTGFSANNSRRSSFKTQCMAQPVNNVGRQKQSKTMGNYRASNSKIESITVEDDSFTTQPIKTETDLDVLFIDSTDGDGSSNQNTLCDFPKQDAVYPQSSSDDFPKAETKVEPNNLNSSLWPLDAASGNDRASGPTKCQNLRKSKQSRDKSRLSESNNWWGNTDGSDTYATWGTDQVGLDDGSGEISGQLLTEQSADDFSDGFDDFRNLLEDDCQENGDTGQSENSMKRQYTCPYEGCGLSFYHKRSCERHQRKKHGTLYGVDSQVTYFCHFQGCGRLFYKPSTLHRHQWEIHGVGSDYQ